MSSTCGPTRGLLNEAVRVSDAFSNAARSFPSAAATNETRELVRQAGRHGPRLAGHRAGRRRQRLAAEIVAEPCRTTAGDRHGRPQLRQGIGAGRVGTEPDQRPETDHRSLLHPLRTVGSGRGIEPDIIVPHCRTRLQIAATGARGRSAPPPAHQATVEDEVLQNDTTTDPRSRRRPPSSRRRASRTSSSTMRSGR